MVGTLTVVELTRNMPSEYVLYGHRAEASGESGKSLPQKFVY